ncbi:hypothetical protein T12_8091 [Trichinella patagoniensis]|uniref:Uncharacterized protein n=1 Tax=Trichinella patagoniensis TaxID=990121 RepID=A0A0V1A8G9_9BILA|nr:hypothetical protein T12_9690 [Trichinella patagoniensis]KRY21138.1 hypothetical protein T12_8091 [Trichinella patagoniensis]
MVLGSCTTFKANCKKCAKIAPMILEMIFSAMLVIKGLLIHLANVYDHTTLKAPHPARSAKLSNVGLTSVPESETVWEHAVS